MTTYTSVSAALIATGTYRRHGSCGHRGSGTGVARGHRRRVLLLLLRLLVSLANVCRHGREAHAILGDLGHDIGHVGHVGAASVELLVSDALVAAAGALLAALLSRFLPLVEHGKLAVVVRLLSSLLVGEGLLLVAGHDGLTVRRQACRLGLSLELLLLFWLLP